MPKSSAIFVYFVLNNTYSVNEQMKKREEKKEGESGTEMVSKLYFK